MTRLDTQLAVNFSYYEVVYSQNLSLSLKEVMEYLFIMECT